jgi:hypothetical protein
VTGGQLARRLLVTEPVQVTLRRPPPVGRPMQLQSDGRQLNLFDGTEHVADAAVVPEAELPPVPAVDRTRSVVAAGRFPGLTDHPFPACFVCGTARTDGLELWAGPVDPSEPRLVAAPFTVPSGHGLPDHVLVWAALDCPGGWSIGLPGRPAVLGRMTAAVYSAPRPDEHCVVVARCDRWEGRKAFSRSSVYGADGRLIGAASQTWIELARAAD